MKMKMKKVLRKVLPLVLVLTMLVFGGVTASAATYAGWQFPVNNPTVTHPFHSAGNCPSSDPAVRNAHSNGHSAVDLIGDTTIKAVAPGKVTKAAWDSNAAYGRRVEIEHSNGTTTSYSHLLSMDVKAGDLVVAGATIGRMGGSGYNRDNYYGVHLHFAIHDDVANKFINPEDIFNFTPPTLTLKYHYWNMTANKTNDPTPNVVTVTGTTWSASVSASWIHASPLSGKAGSTTMDIWVEANPNASPRSGFVEFKTASGLVDKYDINQAGALPNGTYTIQNIYSGRNVDATTNAAPNSPVKLYTKDGSSEQNFELKYNAAKDAFEIISHRCASTPNLWLGVSGSDAVSKTTAQYCKIIKNTDGTYRIVPEANTGLALKAPSTANGEKLVWAAYTSGATSQHFTFTKK